MRKTALLTFAILFGATLHSFAQKIEENKKDDFTNEVIKKISWETLCSTLSTNAHFRISLVNASEMFDLKVMSDKHFYIDKDQELMLKLDNGGCNKAPKFAGCKNM
jgi:hypothetical protein